MTGNGHENLAPLGSIEVLDAETIARLRALAADVAEANESVLQDLFQTFRQDADERMATLRQANARGELQNVSATLHSLKGASVTIGVVRLAAMCRNLEAELRQSGTSLSKEMLDNLDTCIHDSVIALQTAFGTHAD